MSAHASGWRPAYPSGPRPAPSSPYSLEPGRDEDVALFQDARIGFSHLLPGRPALSLARQDDPTADVIVLLQDAPVTLRYKVEAPSGRAASSAEAARLTAERFASWRAQAATRVDFANPSWLLSWGSDAAAIASYDVVATANEQRTREELFVLFRQGLTLLVTWTFPQSFLDDPAYASFASVAEATMVWDPTRWEQRGRVWPESPIVLSGINGRLKPKYVEAGRWLSDITMPDADRSRALGILSGVASNVGAPWVELPPDVFERSRVAMMSVFRSPEVHAFLRNAFAEVRTAHDLRGIAVLLGRALAPRTPSAHPLSR